jgi:hypothetical protein
LNIQPLRILKDAPVGDDRLLAYNQYLADLDKIAARTAAFSDAELECAIDDACDQARRSRSSSHDHKSSKKIFFPVINHLP